MTEEPSEAMRLDIQDPLPEQDWGWRRVFTYTLTLISCAFLLYCLASLDKQSSAREIYNLAWWLIMLIMMLVTFYLLAPSAEQIVKMIQASRNFRHITPNLPFKGPVSEDSPSTVSYTQRHPDGAEAPAQPGSRADEDDAAPRSRT